MYLLCLYVISSHWLNQTIKLPGTTAYLYLVVHFRFNLSATVLGTPNNPRSIFGSKITSEFQHISCTRIETKSLFDDQHVCWPETHILLVTTIFVASKFLLKPQLFATLKHVNKKCLNTTKNYIPESILICTTKIHGCHGIHCIYWSI